MLEMSQIRIFITDLGDICLSQDDCPNDPIDVTFNPCQAEIVAKAILLAAKEATKTNEEEASSDG